MAIHTILQYPDQRLRQEAAPIETITPEIHQLIDDMAETMYSASGAGLAATQIGKPLQLFLVDTAEEHQKSDLRTFINPVILSKEGVINSTEGCLSFPGARVNIDRAASIVVQAQDRQGNAFELTASGFLAIAIQHEYDHLTGTLIIDRVGPLQKRMLHRKMITRSVNHSTNQYPNHVVGISRAFM
ncbi:peptide deformylase [Pajaroellobacter abortibovis]|uniref:Peptide deformylase n=1 Tax=Pajaroellobacter abortibovis TaxID=1882918 RepID=A0A1L6MXG9_9BACT|nr:peptide deformylase [Pajaroellobacter abortibovis]APS00273.1 peptide deformylase [Pajaroellobacter abortibovis]